MLNKISNSLLAPSGLELSHLNQVLDHFSGRDIDYADLYLQLSQDESWSLENSIIKEGGFYIDRGFGVRAVSGEKTGFAYADQITLKQLEQCALAARSISQTSGQLLVKNFKKTTACPRYAAVNPLDTLSREQKVELLHLIDKTARMEDPRVIQVNANLSAVYEEILVAATDGTLATDIRPLVRLSVSVLVEQKGKRERGSAGTGGRFGLRWFLEKQDTTGLSRAESLAKEAVRQALVNLTAAPAPSGTMPIVLGAGWPGILLHEAVGHGLEGDFNRKEASLFSGKIGQMVTSELCTIVDDGTLPDMRGSITIDDEGVPSQRNVLIENGILKGYMQDKLNARLMGVAPTGNGRRESYAHLPMPRMTNTYLTEGNHEFEEMIESVEYGLYAPHFSGGQVDITSGKFVFSTAEAYLIEKGKITKPVTGATLIGSGIEAMQQVSMVGKKMELDPGIGTCGKEGQSMPVGVGQPTVKLDKITVGGRG
ncbi:metalloprotease TldD [Mannheimia pernigra]|uniref:metalloprotease TldD n=1 Tax=Mannheimia pernigra TaxID=111844 RepID=UPI0013185D77|nr:metalloprotease TldD [Mannheimia pernigra]QHB16879.1 metalloprotease TldD [Mannheimia pernigra]